MHSINRVRNFAGREIAQLEGISTTQVDANVVGQMGKLVDMLKDTYEIEEAHYEIKKMREEYAVKHGHDKAHEHDHMKGYGYAADMACHEGWGDANPQARKLFENLEHSYMGYWKHLAEYEKHGDEADKQEMLKHFKAQLHAHDAIASFVKGNCPVACPEIKIALMEWMQKK